MDFDDIDHDLHTVLECAVRETGPHTVDWLVARARRERRDARITEETVCESVASSTLLVERPDGTVDHLSRVLDGIVVAQRARADLVGRTDLWATLALQPILNLLAFGPLLTPDGGEVTRSPFGHEVLVGPPGWLPDVRRFGLVGVRLEQGRLSAERVDEDALPDLATQQRVRALLAHHYRRERWWNGTEDLDSRPAELVRALTLARLEDPDLLRTPYPPLDELLHDPLEQAQDEHHWRDFAACRQGETVSFSVAGMPVALEREIAGRAQRYGMSFDQYVVAVLGHLAWRTPFAEDMEPWEDWNPEGYGAGEVRQLPDRNAG